MERLERTLIIALKLLALDDQLVTLTVSAD